MERTVPSTASDEIDLYLRTMYSLMRSTTEVQIRTLEEVHAGMNSSLHPQARLHAPEVRAVVPRLVVGEADPAGEVWLEQLARGALGDP